MIGFYSKEEVDTTKKKKTKILISDQSANFPTGNEACRQCKLYKQKDIINPKIKPYGKFKKRILIIGEAPGATEDEEGKPFHPKAQAGGLLHKICESVGINLYRDCLIINGCDCRPINKDGSNRTPTDTEIRCCLYRKQKVIKKYKPKYILLLGEKAKKSFYSFDPQRKKYASLPLASLRGLCVPDRNSNAFIFHSYHPSFIKRGNSDMEDIFRLDIAEFSRIVKKNKPLKFIDFKKDSRVLTKYSQVIKLFDKIEQLKLPIIHDYESSSFRYYEKIHEVYLVSIHIKGRKTTYTIPLDFPKGNKKKWWNKKQRKIIFERFKGILENPDIPIIAQNIKHEIQCAHYLLNAKVTNVFHDTMIAAHLINENKDITGLKKQAYLKFGQYNYGISDAFINAEPQQKNKFKDLPFETATEYCSIDSKITDRLVDPQLRILKKRKLLKANKLFLEGVQAFAEIERNGIKLNLKLANRYDSVWGDLIEEYKDKILSCKEAKKFERVKGRPLKFEKKLSDDDLRYLLFNIHKLKSIKQTKTTDSVDVEVLPVYAKHSELVSFEMERRKLDKLKNTYLAQIFRLQVDGFIYPSFNLHIARSFRSSSDSPNFQNFPKRSDGGKELRKIFISRFGNEGILAEVDYGSMEVRIIACITKDPALIDYLMTGGDMHGDWAEEIFRIKKKEIDPEIFKKLRYIAKNHWVFPLFYGSWYKSVARTTDIFEIFKEHKLDNWCKNYAQWESHLKKCEEKFWKQFKGVRKWQDNYSELYRKQGFVKDFSWGFETHGYLSRNQIYNFPIQGPAYHCLQYTINNLWRNDFYNFVSLLCGQIHDALFWDCMKNEFNKVRRKVHYLMTEKIREDNPWIIVPLIDEWSKGPNWASMTDVNWTRIEY